MAKKPDWLKPHGTPWTRGPGRLVYDNPWLSVQEFDAVAPTGAPALYGLVHQKNFGIAVVPLHEDATITLVGQNRFPLGYSWEVPEGGGRLDVDPLESARRELKEETGLVAADWRQILTMQLSNSVTDERAFAFLAMDFTQSQTDPDDTEDIAVARVAFPEALQAAVDGYIEDALTVASLLRLHHMAVQGELPGGLARLMLGSPA
ncbi:MAG: hydrolase [Caulobacter sp.]|nr:hydrolase [Caulobacter sp.]